MSIKINWIPDINHSLGQRIFKPIQIVICRNEARDAACKVRRHKSLLGLHVSKKERKKLGKHFAYGQQVKKSASKLKSQAGNEIFQLNLEFSCALHLLVIISRDLLACLSFDYRDFLENSRMEREKRFFFACYFLS